MDIIKIKQRSESSATVYVPHALYRNTIKKVSFSNKNVPCECVETEENECFLSKDIWTALSLPFPLQLRAKVVDDTLYFLPFIGIFTTGYTEGSLYPFGQRTEDYRKLIKFTENKGGCAFILTPDHIDWENGSVRGVFLHNGKWIEKNVPFPQVIYDRVPNRRAEHSPKVKKIKSKFQNEYGIPWFNSGFFDKWEIIQSLQNHPISIQYLPETFDFNYFALKRSLETYPSIYIKPKNASHGVGIKHLQMVDGEIVCSENRREGTSDHHFDNVEDLLNKEFAEHHPSQYILQQGIKLPHYKEKPFDFRVHTNKDGHGQWQMSAVAVKVGGTGRLTTHVAYGGEVKTLGEIYGKEKAHSTLDLLSDAALTLSEIIDQQTDGLIGELGLDLVIDHENRVWLFEANSKPGHVIFNKPALKKQERLVEHYWFDYCQYLTELLIRKPEWLLSTV